MGKGCHGSLLETATPGDYVVIMAYIPQSSAVDFALEDLRRRVTERFGIATTMGTGPGSCTPPANYTKAAQRRGCFCRSRLNTARTSISRGRRSPLARWPMLKPWETFKRCGRPDAVLYAWTLGAAQSRLYARWLKNWPFP